MASSRLSTPNTAKKQVKSLDILQFLSLRRFFSELYAACKREADKYSYRAFSAELGYGETNFMHLVCSGKRKISPQTAREVADKLELSHARRKYFLALARFENSRVAAVRNEILEELAAIVEETLPTRMSKDQFAYFSNWQNAVIRELATRSDFRADAIWIARNIVPAISVEKAQEALQLLVRIGYLQEKNGTFVTAAAHIRSPKEAKSAALFRYHNQMIEMGRTSMTRIEGWRRDISGVTVRVDADTVQQIKSEIQAFRSRILELSEQCNPQAKQIYQMNIQFFPFTEQTEDASP